MPHRVAALAFEGMAPFELGCVVEIFRVARPEGVGVVRPGRLRREPRPARRGRRFHDDPVPRPRRLRRRPTRSSSQAFVTSATRSPRRSSRPSRTPTPRARGSSRSAPGPSRWPPRGCSTAGPPPPTGGTPPARLPLPGGLRHPRRPVRRPRRRPDQRRQRGGARPAPPPRQERPRAHRRQRRGPPPRSSPPTGRAVRPSSSRRRSPRPRRTPSAGRWNGRSRGWPRRSPSVTSPARPPCRNGRFSATSPGSLVRARSNGSSPSGSRPASRSWRGPRPRSRRSRSVCGFDSPVTFRHHFTRAMRTSPSAYRRAFQVGRTGLPADIQGRDNRHEANHPSHLHPMVVENPAGAGRAGGRLVGRQAAAEGSGGRAERKFQAGPPATASADES